MILPSGSNGPHGVAGVPGPSWGIHTKPAPPDDYVTWANTHDVDIRYCGIDVRAALLALDLLRSRNPSYEGLRVTNVSTISLIKRMFQLEFDTDLPPAEMLRDMGAKIRSHDAESVLNAIRDTSSPF
jgi:hypothetical protein